jgi:sulfide:quinone oxidoreductase
VAGPDARTPGRRDSAGMTTNLHPERLRVLVAGGGVAGMEAILALRALAAERVDITLLTPESTFTYRPMAVAVPFARGRVQRLELADFARESGTRLVRGSLAAVEPGLARTAAGAVLPYDALLVAVGAWSEPAVPGATTWTPHLDQEVMGGLLSDIEGGYAKRVAFVVPPGASWPLPAYELALMTAWDARDMGQDDVEITIHTPEQAPMAIFGAHASESLRRDLDEAGVTVRTGRHPYGDLAGTRVIALPRAAARPVAGLPRDEHGFFLVDAHGRVPGLDGVWAAGDCTTFPIKQGGLAAQQADAAAESIAAHAGVAVDPSPFRPVLRGVLLTGRGRRWIRRSLETAGDHGESQRRALWWPPTKIAGAHLAPYLARHARGPLPGEGRPAGRLVEFRVPVGGVS